jgi:flagellar hook capping protein FlgD
VHGSYNRPAVPQSRLASLLLVALIALAAVAFLRTEQLKLTKSPVARPEIKQWFSPACTGSPDCRTTASLRFTLRGAETLTLEIRNADGATVRTLERDNRHPKGVVKSAWDGRDDDGDIAPDGRYELAVHLQSGDRTITIPSPIILDTRPPSVHVTRVERLADKVKVHFIASEPARLFRRVALGGKVVDEAPTRPAITRIRFAGLQAGAYTVTIFAQDRAGNSTPDPPTIRFRVP